MCLQVPGKVIKIEKDTAVIDYDIEKRKVNVADIRPKTGDWVIVVGKFIVDIVPEDAARESLNHWKKIMNY